MKAFKMISAVVAFAAAGTAFAQQSEFVAPDAGFKSNATRAEVRQAEANAYAAGTAVQQQRDGKDHAYVTTRSREDIRAEHTKAAKSQRPADISNIYFGA